MSQYSHDEIVIATDKVIIETVKQIVDELLQSSGLVERDLLLYSKISLLRQFIESGQYESIRRVNRPPIMGTRKRPDIELFGGLIVIEVESSESTLEDGKKQLENYINEFYKEIAQYGIVTTGLVWKIYQNNKGVLNEIVTLKGDEKEYNKSIENSIKAGNVYIRLYNLLKGVLLSSGVYKLDPLPDNIRRVFYPVLTYVNDLTELLADYNIHEKAFYQSYKEILSRVYGKLTKSEIDILFITHTLLQMITNVVVAGAFGKLEKVITEPLRACSGEEVEYDITIPHLMWWKELSVASDSFKIKIDEICRDIYYRALLFNWSASIIEDVFSHLYEDFIDRILRSKIGEYYTPWWLIEVIIHHMKNKFNMNLKDKLILDPSCGSGRFLVKAFYEKILSGEDPDKAYYEVIGLDILPLATTIARAELMIAYRRASGRNVPGTPLIFWGDFLSNEIGLGAEVVSEFEGVLKRFTKIIWESPELNRLSKNELLLFLARLEYQLEQIFKELAGWSSMININSERFVEILNNIVSKLESIKPLNSIDHLVKTLIIKMLGDVLLMAKIVELIQKYGNEIWAIPIVSHIFVKFLGKIRPDVVLTNPPWLKLSELPDSEWGQKVHEYIKENIIKKNRERIPGISKVGMSGDISALFLDLILKILEREGYIGIVMPAEQSYVPKSPHGTGKLLTYAVLSKYDINGSVIYVGDAFKHGRHASVLVLRVKKE